MIFTKQTHLTFIKNIKVAFFQKVRFVFSNLQKKNTPKNYPELEIHNSCPEHDTVMGGNFEFQVQDSFLKYFALEIWRFEKTNRTF